MDKPLSTNIHFMGKSCSVVPATSDHRTVPWLQARGASVCGLRLKSDQGHSVAYKEEQMLKRSTFAILCSWMKLLKVENRENQAGVRGRRGPGEALQEVALSPPESANLPVLRRTVRLPPPLLPDELWARFSLDVLPIAKLILPNHMCCSRGRGS